MRTAVKQVLPAGDQFYAQLLDQVICGAGASDPVAIVAELTKASCVKGTSLTEDRKPTKVTLGCGRFDSRNRFVSYRGPYAELRADGAGRFRLVTAGRYYAGPRKEKLWLVFDLEERLASIEYYEVGVEFDRLTVLDPSGGLVEAGKIRFSQLDAQYYRIGRWRRGGGQADVVYAENGEPLILEDLKKRTSDRPRSLNVTFGKRRMFFPVQSGRVLLPVSCNKKQSYNWGGSGESFLWGMKPGSRVLVIDREGRDVPATLGAIECLSGACGQQVLAVALIAESPLTTSHFAVAQLGDGKSLLKTLPEEGAFSLINKGRDFFEFLAEDRGRYLGMSVSESQVRVLQAEFSGRCCPQVASFTEYDVSLLTRVPKVVSTYTTPDQTCD